jgi:hypothetical protein
VDCSCYWVENSCIQGHQFFLSNTFPIHILLSVPTATLLLLANIIATWTIMTAFQRNSLSLQCFERQSQGSYKTKQEGHPAICSQFYYMVYYHGEQNPKSLTRHEEFSTMWPLLNFLFLITFFGKLYNLVN